MSPVAGGAERGAGELEGWLRLTLTPGVGSDAARRLLAAFGLPSSVFAQPRRALEQVVSARQAQALSVPPDGLPALLARTLAWLDAGGEPRHVLPLGHALYPASLLRIEDPPVLLYAMGQVERLAQATAAVALVGSRSPTPQGALNARQFARTLALSGFTVVSGLALGVDAAAHLGALESVEGAEGAGGFAPERSGVPNVAGVPDVLGGASTDPAEGRAPESAPAGAPGAPPEGAALATIAVVGTGLDRVYPRSHLALARTIAAHGVILSEYPLGTPPLAGNFPRRNRLIAGLSLGTLVVEAAVQSGSLITARLASEQGKEVMAIPGSIHSVQSRGCHALIKQGAKLVECAEDVLEELRPQLVRAGALFPAPPGAQRNDGSDNGSDDRADRRAERADGPGADREDPVLQALGFDPVSLDALAARTGLGAAALQARLLDLELAGQVDRLPGGLFLRLARA